jgi:hypothetical protein
LWEQFHPSWHFSWRWRVWRNASIHIVFNNLQ